MPKIILNNYINESFSKREDIIKEQSEREAWISWGLDKEVRPLCKDTIPKKQVSFLSVSAFLP